jgi:hypothetical protein
LKRNTGCHAFSPNFDLQLNFKRSRLATFLAGRLRGKGVRVGEVASLSSGTVPYFVLYNILHTRYDLIFPEIYLPISRNDVLPELVPPSAQAKALLSAIQLRPCDSTSNDFSPVIGILTSGFSASCYVFRDGLCIWAPALRERKKEPGRSRLVDQNWHL